MKVAIVIAAAASACLGLATPAQATTAQAQAARAEFLAHPTEPAPQAGVICIVDSGVDEVPDLHGQIVGRVSLVGDDPGDDPSRPHGTHVASVAAARADDGYGIEGIWPAAKIYSVKVIADSDDQLPSASDYVRGIDRCIDARYHEGHPVRVINLAIGAPAEGVDEGHRAELKDAVTRARRRNIHVVAAAGNSGTTAYLPAAEEQVLAVAALDADDAACPFSSGGPTIDVAALGCGVALAHTANGQRAEGFGSSFSAPSVSAVLAALHAYVGDLSVAQAEALLLDTVRGETSGVDAESLFRSAGLSHMIPARPSAAAPTVASTPSQAAEPRAAPHCLSARRWCRALELTWLIRTRHTLKVRFRDLPSTARVVVKIDGRRQDMRQQAKLVSVRMPRRFRRISFQAVDSRRGRSAILLFTASQLPR